MVTKKRISISITPDTEERLKQYAYENHKSVSQSITDWIWGEKVKNETIRGQQSMEIIKPPKREKPPRSRRRNRSGRAGGENPKPKSRQRTKTKNYSR